MEPPWPCADDSGTMHISKKGLKLLKSHSKVLFCAAYSLPSMQMFVSHSFLQICLLPLRQVAIMDMLSLVQLVLKYFFQGKV